MADTLIIYYTSTGYNEKVAKLLSEKIDTDLFPVEPVKPYPTDMWVAGGLAKQERDDDKLPELKTGYPDMSKYQRILFWGPAWGYTLANPLLSFLAKADFAGKPVYPWVKEYLSDLKKQLRNGQVHDLLELTMGILNDAQLLGELLSHQ